LRRPWTDEERAGPCHLPRHCLIVDDEMLGGRAIGQCDRFGARSRDDDAAMHAKRGPGGSVGRHAAHDCRDHARRELAAWRDEHRPGIGVVLSLRDEIGGEPFRAPTDRHDHDLRRAGIEIDPTVGGHQSLGGCDPSVAGADDLVDARHRLCAIGQSGHRVGAADAEQPRDAGFECRRHDHGVRPGADRHDFTHAGGGGREGCHQQ
jgi:hypothetical protein